MYTTEGIILKKIDIGEANALFTIYTKDYGKIRAVAQGIKKEGAKLKGHLELLSMSTISFILGKNTPRLIHASLTCFWPSIREDTAKIKTALRIATAVNTHCLENDRDTSLWSVLFESLFELEHKKFSPEELGVFMRTFEDRFVASLGYGAGHTLQSLEYGVF